MKALFSKLCDPPSKIARALRRGITRFVTNTRLNGAQMVARVVTANARSLLGQDEIVVAHDSSENDKHGRGVPADAGPLRSSQARGYLLHLAVACSPGGRLFGAIDAFAWTRPWKLRNGDHESRPPHLRESRKWDRGVDRTEKRLRELGFQGRVFHTEDREADDYSHLANQQAQGRMVIVRRNLKRERFVKAARPVAGKNGKLRTKWISLDARLNALVYRGSYDVDVDSRRTDRARGLTHAVRTATVEFRYTKVTFKPPRRYRGKAKSGLTVWVVEAKERYPPAGFEPLHWQLISLYPVNTDQDALRVIELYKRRWKCEDYIKICKSGCQLEAQHVDSLASFKRLLALSLSAANQLSEIVAASREQPPRPLEEVLDSSTLAALRDTAEYHRVPLPPGQPTVPQVLLTVAKIGGFEPCRGRVPGWLVLTRGWVRVLEHQAIVTHDRTRAQRPP